MARIWLGSLGRRVCPLRGRRRPERALALALHSPRPTRARLAQFRSRERAADHSARAQDDGHERLARRPGRPAGATDRTGTPRKWPGGATSALCQHWPPIKSRPLTPSSSASHSCVSAICLRATLDIVSGLRQPVHLLIIILHVVAFGRRRRRRRRMPASSHDDDQQCHRRPT
jgi:hypothetical protein